MNHGKTIAFITCSDFEQASEMDCLHFNLCLGLKHSYLFDKH